MRTDLLAKQPSLSAAAVDDLVCQQFDALTIDWLTDIPRNQETMTWYERYLLAVAAKQVTVPGTVTTAQGSHTTDAIGLFTGFDGSGYRQDLMFFYSGDWAYMSGHYLNLMTTSTIRKLRTSIYAQFAAMYSYWQYVGSYEQRLSSQWILTLSGWVCSSYFILRSQAVLQARGVWQSSDAMTSTNWAQAKVTNADMITMTESLLSQYVLRLNKLGLTESLSTYYGYVYNVLAQMLMHAPTQNCYNMLEQVWKMLWFDLASNWHPGTSSFAGPSGRHYDLTTGLHSMVDLWDIVMYVQPLYPPNCAFTMSNRRGDGTIVDQTINLCVNGTQATIPFTLGIGDFNLLRFQQGAVQAAGFMYMPYDSLLNISQSSPYRTLKALTTNNRGQERHNFIAPNYQLGFGAEEIYGVELANIIVGRLSGVPKAGTPTAVVRQNEPSQTHAYLRQMPEYTDNPFYRDGTTYGVVSHDEPILGRFMNSQEKNFMLTTSFIAGQAGNNGADEAYPFNTDIIMPLTVDALYADNYPLPITSGTIIALPPTAILTARHGNATMVVRILHLDTASNIQTATKPTVITDTSNRYAVSSGLQQYSLTWQVDALSIQAGCGRVTIHHKNKGDQPTVGGYRISTLWGAGDTPSDRDMWALQRTVRHATWTESITPQNTGSNAWLASDQPWYGKPKRSWDGSSPLGQCQWSTQVVVSSTVTLSVSRTDVFQPNTNDKAYQHPSAPLNAAPFYFAAGFTRLSSGTNIFSEFESAYGITWQTDTTWTGIPFRALSHVVSDVSQPHLTEPVLCTPGQDFPCWQWQTSSWSACSVTCSTGLQTRTLKCVDASDNNAVTADSILCPAVLPALTQLCNVGLCAPGAPTILKAEPLDSALDLSWNPPASTGGSAITRYVALVQPGNITVTATASPMRIGSLINGMTYTVKLAAINNQAVGAYSTSMSVTPDVYSWVYSSWTGCSSYCGGGSQTRTVSCSGATVGAADASACTVLSDVPTDLKQNCNTNPCAWIAQTWGACSSVCSGGNQTRVVGCSTGVQDGKAQPSGLPSSFCTSTMPTTIQVCNTQACSWVQSAWSDCTATCGGGTQTKTLQCTDGNGAEQLPSVCAQTIGSVSSQEACNTAACLPAQWSAGAWSTCTAACGGGVQTRSVTCVDSTGAQLDSSRCVASSMPTTQQTCGTGACTWQQGDWSECSLPCGGGTQSRSVKCTDPFGALAPSSRCTGTQPVTAESCNVDPCVWVVTPYSDCSVTCGTGQASRTVTCSDTHVILDNSFCTTTPMPQTVELCSAPYSCPSDLTPPKLVSVSLGYKSATIVFEVDPDQTGGYIVRAQSVTPVAAGFVVASETNSTIQVTVPESDPNTLFAYGTASPITLVGLVTGAVYRFKVDTTNSGGQSNTTDWSEALQTFGPPSVPMILDVEPLGVDRLTVTFAAGAVSGAQPPPQFFILTQPTGGTASGSSSPLVVTGLQGGMNYTIILYASNPAGDSDRVSSSTMYSLQSVESTTPVSGTTSMDVHSSTNLITPLVATFGTLAGIALSLGGLWTYRKCKDHHRLSNAPTTSSAAGSASPSNEPSRVGEYRLEQHDDASGPRQGNATYVAASIDREQYSLAAIPQEHTRTLSQVRIEISPKDNASHPLSPILGSPSLPVASPAGHDQMNAIGPAMTRGGATTMEPWSLRAGGYSPVTTGVDSQLSPSPSPSPNPPPVLQPRPRGRAGVVPKSPEYSPVFHG